MKPLKSDPAKTMLTITTGFLVMYVIMKHPWMLKVAVICGLVGVLSTFLSAKVEWLWMKLINILGLIMPNVMLTLVFYIFLFPFAMLAKIFGSTDALKLKNNSPSVYRESNKHYTAASFERPW